MQIDNFLSVFRRELIRFAGDNVALAGGVVDEVHGQQLFYQATVLNLIVFNATTAQIAKVKVEFEDDPGAVSTLFDGYTAFTVTDTDSGLILNVIFKDKPIPENLMLFEVEKPFWVSVPDNKNGCTYVSDSIPAKAEQQRGIYYKCLPINS